MAQNAPSAASLSCPLSGAGESHLCPWSTFQNPARAGVDPVLLPHPPSPSFGVVCLLSFFFLALLPTQAQCECVEPHVARRGFVQPRHQRLAQSTLAAQRLARVKLAGEVHIAPASVRVVRPVCVGRHQVRQRVVGPPAKSVHHLPQQIAQPAGRPHQVEALQRAARGTRDASVASKR